MPRKQVDPAKLRTAMAMREAGYTLSVISEKTGISPRTLTRHFRVAQVRKGRVSAEEVERLRRDLRSSLDDSEAIRDAIAAGVQDDLALASAIRVKALEALESLDTDTHEKGRETARALASLATTVKLSQEVSRRATGADAITEDMAEGPLPVLVVQRMTDEEVELARARANCPDDELH